MSVHVDPWSCVPSEAESTEQLARMATIWAVVYPPAAVPGQVDQVWSWPGHSLHGQPVATSQAGGHLHSQPADTPPSITDSGSASSQQVNTPSNLQDDAFRAPASSKRTLGSVGSHPNRLPRHPEPRRKMPAHQPPRKKEPPTPDPASASASASASTSSSFSSKPKPDPKPKKRGRKPKNPPEASPTTPPPQDHLDDLEDFDDFDNVFDDFDDDDFEEDDLPKDPRRRRTLERNRIAAKKCRVRKRDEASALASREQAVEDQNRYLSTCLNSLSTEVYLLKTELLRHTHCNCTLIQEYIANEAKRSVEKLNASPSVTHSCSHTTPTGLENQTRRSSYFDTESASFPNHMAPDSLAVEPIADGWMDNLHAPDDIVAPSPTYGRSHPYTQADAHGHMHDERRAPPTGQMAGFDPSSHGQTFGQMLDSIPQYEPSYFKSQH